MDKTLSGASFLTVADTAPIFGVSEMTIRRALEEEGWPSIRVSRCIRIPEAFVRNLVESANTEAALAILRHLIAQYPDAAIANKESALAMLRHLIAEYPTAARKILEEDRRR